MQPGSSVPLRRSSKPQFLFGLDYAPELCGLSAGVLLASTSIFYIISAVVESFAALVLLCSCEWLPFDDIFSFPIIILLDVVDRSVLAVFFGGQTNFRTAGFIILTYCSRL